MGAHFSSVQISGGVESSSSISTSYAYSAGNPSYFGVDATYSFDGPGFAGPVGQVTPYLVQPVAPTATCSPISVYSTGQSLLCPVHGTDLVPGQYTLVFSQYTSTSFTTDSAGNTIYAYSQSTASGDNPNTLTDSGGDYAFSIIAPTSTVTVTPTLVASTTIISGISEIDPSATDTVPATIVFVTVYQTTLISTSTFLSTLSGAFSTSTITASCTKSSSSSTSKSSSTTKPSTITSSTTKTTSSPRPPQPWQHAPKMPATTAFRAAVSSPPSSATSMSSLPPARRQFPHNAPLVSLTHQRSAQHAHAS